MVQSQGRLPKVSTKPATKTPRSTLAHARLSSTPLIKKTTYRPTDLQGPFPAEIWLWIIEYLSALDLFSLYNTSATLRVLTVPSLVQLIASKSVRLFFYQEYVCRTGITFVFDHFDFTRDKVVFKPQSTHHTITFQNGITIQRPQLEEISVSSQGSRCQGGQVVCSEEGIYSICKGVEGSSPVAGRTSSRSRGGQDASFRNEYHFENRLSMLNYMDRVCALNIKRAGRRFLSGKKYSFGHDYPWALHYVIDDKPCGRNSIRSNGIGGATPHFPFDIPNNSNNNNGNNDVDRRNSRARYLQAGQFECSINFLDPRRASRSLLRRWIDGKMSQLLHIVHARQMMAALSNRKLYLNGGSGPCKAHVAPNRRSKSRDELVRV